MTPARMRRLSSDYEEVKKNFAGHKNIIVTPVGDEPPEKWTDSPSPMSASGASFAIAVRLCPNLPPPWEQNGMIRFPEKSYSSRNDAIGMGMDAHQFG